MEQTIDYAIELDPDFANFYPAVPYPGHGAVREVRARRAAAGRRRRRLVEDGVLVLPAARQRAGRAGRDGRDQPRQAPVLPAAGLHRRATSATSRGSRSPSRRSSGRCCHARCSARGSSTPAGAASARPGSDVIAEARPARDAAVALRAAAAAQRRNGATQSRSCGDSPALPSGSSCSRRRSVPRTRTAPRRRTPGRPRTSSSRQILKPPAEMRTPRARSRRIRKKPDVASRTGVSARAIRHASRDITQPADRPVARAAAGDVAAADRRRRPRRAA